MTNADIMEERWGVYFCRWGEGNREGEYRRGLKFG
jgi:hypothetical protein